MTIRGMMTMMTVMIMVMMMRERCLDAATVPIVWMGHMVGDYVSVAIAAQAIDLAWPQPSMGGTKPCHHCCFPFAWGYRCPCGVRLCSQHCADAEWPQHRHTCKYAQVRKILRRAGLTNPLPAHILSFVDIREEHIAEH